MWKALGDCAARGDGKMEWFKLEVSGRSAWAQTVNDPSWRHKFQFHNVPAPFVGISGPHLSLELPLRPPLAYKRRAYVAIPSR
jgi:hypothetical protein